VSFKADIHIQWFRSGTSGNGLGGTRFDDEIVNRTLSNLFPTFTEQEQQDGKTKHRCVYMRNMHPSIPFKNPIFYIPVNTTSPNTEIWVGIDPAGIGNGSTTGVATSITNETDDPVGVNFTQATTRKEGFPLRVDLPANGVSVGVWFKLRINPKAETRQADYCKIAVDSDNKAGDTGLPADPIDTVVGVVGETDQNNNSQDLLDRFQLRNLDWLLFNGNVSTGFNPSWFINLLGRLKDLTIFSWGNQDVRDISIRNMLTNAFSYNNRRVGDGFYSKNINNLHFLVMDTSGFQSYENPSSQYDFVVEDLENASRDDKINFIIVSLSDTMYGALPGNDTTILHNDTLRRTYHKLFQDNGVHVVFQSKIRNYQFLGNLKYNEDNTEAPSTLLSGPNYSITNGAKSFGVDSGVLFVNVGSGGRTPFHTLTSLTAYPQSFASVPTVGGTIILKSEMKRPDRLTVDGKPYAKLTGTYYNYARSKSLLSVFFGATIEEKSVHEWSIVIT
jgi:hypothetical protein